MNNIKIANVLLTRRCNLSCSYCGIIRDHEDKPEEYPSISDYHKNELSASKWIEAISGIIKLSPECFFIFYGGEPLLFDGIDEILDFCNTSNIAYTVISNSTGKAATNINRVFKKIGKIRGFTASVDPVIHMNNQDPHILTKSKSGFEILKYMKDNDMATDIVAEITATKSSLPYLRQTVQMLTNEGIYSSITAVDIKKSEFYDFSNVKDSDEMIEKNSDTRDILLGLYADNDLLIHIRETLLSLYSNLPSSYTECGLDEEVHNISIDPDGSMRLCLRIKGIDSGKINIFDALENDVLLEAFKKDKMSVCKGCNWTCPMMSFGYGSRILSH